MCDPTEVEYDCTVSVIDNSFLGNSAARKGGALRYENANFTEHKLSVEGEVARRLQAERNGFAANEAAYGSDMASFPYAIEYIVEDNASGANIDMSIGKLELAAGQEFKMELRIVD